MKADQIKLPFLITPCHCSNWFPFAAMISEKELVIGVIPTPTKAIAIVTGIIALVFVGFVWLTIDKGADAFGSVIALGVLTTVGTPLLISCHFHRERSLGPVLIHKENKSHLELARHRKNVAIADIDCVAVVTAHDAGSDWMAQLQLHTVAGERLLLATADVKNELMPLVEKIQEHVKVPARFLKQKSRNELQEQTQS